LAPGLQRRRRLGRDSSWPTVVVDGVGGYVVVVVGVVVVVTSTMRRFKLMKVRLGKERSNFPSLSRDSEKISYDKLKIILLAGAHYLQQGEIKTLCLIEHRHKINEAKSS
jgi:hypothetical protein